MLYTGKSRPITVLGRELTFYNQRCRDWTHPYEWKQGDGDNLSNAGCGIFSLCHAGQWLTGRVFDPEAWADFSCLHGGRGDDGTDRPGLLHGLMAAGRAEELGFRYEEDGLRNDTDTLFAFLRDGRGVSLCNLRPGHIVCLVSAREREGVPEVLAVDSYSESASDRVKDAVTELIPDTEILWPVRNASGLVTGSSVSFAAFWARLSTVRDFNLLHRI